MLILRCGALALLLLVCAEGSSAQEQDEGGQLARFVRSLRSNLDQDLDREAELQAANDDQEMQLYKRRGAGHRSGGSSRRRHKYSYDNGK